MRQQHNAPKPPDTLVIKGVDVAPHMMTLPGGLYLKVPGRYLLFRQDHPLGRVETKPYLIDLERGIAIFTASVYTVEGQLLATATGSETLRGFPAGWIEKAETVAAGRALATAGYGTQFATADFHGQEDAARDAGVDEGKLADAPVAPAKRPAPLVLGSDERKAAIQALNDAKNRLGLTRPQVEEAAEALFRLKPGEMDAQQLRDLVEHLTPPPHQGDETPRSSRHNAQQGGSEGVA